MGLACFKAYDIRGRVPSELDEELARRIGLAYAAVVVPPGPVAVGWDIRLSGPSLARALIDGLNRGGVDTLELGQVITEVVYHAAGQEGVGGGIMVTASHNPAEYNGMKLVRREGVPVSGDSGLNEIAALVAQGETASVMPGKAAPAAQAGRNRPWEVTADYVARLLKLVKVDHLKPLHLLVNAGNGAAGPIFDTIAARLPLRVSRINHQPDGTFPNGVPNPLLPTNREATAEAVRRHGADLGVAWDGDGDRCFFFDEQGNFIEGYYLVGLLAAQMLRHNPGAKIIHDPRLYWNTVELVEQAGGVPVASKTGHAFIKERMRAENAVYGGEMSAHHYFRDFAYCDSGMLPWLLVVEQLSSTDRPLSALVAERINRYPCSGELNFRLADPAAARAAVTKYYREFGPVEDYTDGLSMDFGAWRFNLRSSNTEPLLRLNVETRGDAALLQEQVARLQALILSAGEK